MMAVPEGNTTAAAPVQRQGRRQRQLQIEQQKLGLSVSGTGVTPQSTALDAAAKKKARCKNIPLKRKRGQGCLGGSRRRRKSNKRKSRKRKSRRRKN